VTLALGPGCFRDRERRLLDMVRDWVSLDKEGLRDWVNSNKF
jgi:hypothetical protein